MTVGLDRQAGDPVAWDDRCLLHRATPDDTGGHRRPMAGDPEDLAGAATRLA